MQRSAVTTTTIALFLLANAWMVTRKTADAGQAPFVSIEPRVKPDRAALNSQGHRPVDIRIASNLVLIPVNVTDVRDRVVIGLVREDFKLFENQVEQSITHFASEDAPVSVCFVFDSSGSMGSKLRSSREAVTEMLKTANPDDEHALIEFNQRPRILVPLTDFAEEIHTALTFAQSKGHTALLDAIYLALQTMKKARHSRKALVIISDGGDNCSRYTVPEVKSLVREADVQIFAIGIFEEINERWRTREELNGPVLLNEIAEETGGRLFPVENLNELRGIASRISIALRHQYLLGYSPKNVERDGKYHRVHIKVAGH